MSALETYISTSSGIMSLINTDTPLKSASSMASPAVLSPRSTYPPPPPYSGWAAPGLHPTSGLISPPDSRRTSDGRTEPPPLQVTTTPLQRQSLPSIHEALSSNSGGPRTHPYTSPISASHHQAAYPQTQPSSGPRAYAQLEHQNFPTPPPNSQLHDHSSPPQPMHPTSFPRSDAFLEDTRRTTMTSLQNAPAPPPNPYAPRYERFEDRRASDMASIGHSFQSPQQSYGYGPGSNQPPPPIQGPAFTYPNYPTHGHEPMDGWKSQKSGSYEFQDHVNRSLDAYDFENCLTHVNKHIVFCFGAKTDYI